MNLVMLESSGNQKYIFGSNRLAEAIGASQLTLEAGTDAAMRAMDTVFGTSFTSPSLEALTEALLRQEWGRADGPTVINAMSGKALIAVPSREKGIELVQAATKIAIIKMPGLQFSGFVSEQSFEWDDPECTLESCSREAHEGIAKLRADAHQPIERYRQWPLADICATSGLPAREEHTDKGESVRASAVALAKHRALDRWSSRARTLGFDDAEVVDSVKKLERHFDDKARKWAVIHADGNGLGRIFQSFADKADEHRQAILQSGGEISPPNVHYARTLCEFSIAIDEATRAAFSEALSVFGAAGEGQEGKFVPVVPIILGGDDLTAITDANKALKFTAEFLRKYEEKTRDSAIISALTDKQGLSACAGVAIIGKNYPFHHAYDLAEALIGSAKSIKRHGGGSALDFHVLFDSLTPNLEHARRCGGNPAYRLTMKPYVVSSRASSDEDQAWAALRQWDGLSEAVDTLGKSISADKLSTRALQRVRESLQRDCEAGSADYISMRQRQTGFKDWDKLLTGSGEYLFVAARSPSGDKIKATRLLDVLEVYAQGWRL